MRLTTIILTTALLSNHVYGRNDSYDGGVPIRIKVGDATCINSNKHSISLHLRRYLVGKDVGWFSSDSEAGILINTIIEGEINDDGTPISQNVPKLIKQNVSEYKKGIVSLPIETKIFHNFNLKNNERTFHSIDLSFKVLKKKKKDNFGIALDQLSTISKTIPANIDPFTPAFSYFADYANSVVEQSLNDSNNVDSSLTDANLAISFSYEDNCSGDDATTGAIAVIKNYSHEKRRDRDEIREIKRNTIDISKVNEYCFTATYRPTFAIHFKPKSTDACPTTFDDTFTELYNPYTLFILNARTIKGRGLASSSSNNKLIEGNKERCDLFDIADEDCN